MKNLSANTAKFDLIQANDATGLHIQDDGGNGLFIKDGGNIGIGTSTPDVKLAVAGTTSANAYTFYQNTLTDASEAIHRPTTGQLAIRANSQERVRIDTNGNVGIGTSNPGSKLHVDGNIYLSEASNLLFLSQTGFSPKINNSTNDQELSILTDNQVRVHVDTDGNVGIGTTGPINDLHLHSATTGVGPIIQLSNDTGDCRLFFGANNTTGAANAAGQIRYNVMNDHLTFYSNLNERMRIDSEGNVGIGATNPSNGKLEILNPTSTVATTDSVDLAITQNASATSSKVQLRSGVTSGDNPYFAIRTRNNNSASSEPGLIKERMRITSAGNVGIGTTNPGAKLEVDYVASTQVGLTLNGSNTTLNNAIQLTDASDNVITLSINAGKFGINGGNVGIGTANPDVRLVVADNHSGDDVALRVWNSSTTDNSTSSLRFTNTSSTNYDHGYIIAGRTPDPYMQFGVANSVMAVHIDSTGKVGIGTTDPKFGLDIKGKNGIAVRDSPGVVNSQTNMIRTTTSSVTHDDWGVGINVVNENTASNGYGMAFWTRDAYNGSYAERVRISRSGSLCINTTSPRYGSKLDVEGAMYVTGVVKLNNLIASADVRTDAAKQLFGSSDMRLKNDLGDCEYGLNEILQIKPKRYTWKEGPEDQSPTVGFFSQDLHSIIPEAAPREAITQEDGSPQLDETGEQDYKWGINSQAIIVALVNAVKDQQAVIEQLKTRIDTLENN
jgi:hypothetical protein